MHTASSALRTCSAYASASEYTATERTPSRRRVPCTRHAISPRFAIRTLSNTVDSRVPEQQPDRRRVVRVAWIVQLRAVADQADHVHVRAHLDVLAAGGDAVFERQLAVGR